MTPYYSLNPPAGSGSGPSLQGQTQQLFISPSNQDCPTLFNIFDQRQTIEFGGFKENYYQQDDNKMVVQDGSSSNSNSYEPIMDDTSNTCEPNNLTSNKMEEDSKNNVSHGSGKWMSSKMRLMKKMMSPTTDKALINPSPRFQNQGHESRYSQRSPRNNNSGTTRVCSDCNTSSTPLWRSGPKGPKSLCNACGIRQRKARRAMAEAANGVVTPTNAACAKTRVHNKEKKSRANHFTHFKNKYNKSTTTTITVAAPAAASSSPEGVKKLEYFNDFTISLRNNSSFQQVFPRDEVAEAAMLLMDLSCGLVH